MNEQKLPEQGNVLADKIDAIREKVESIRRTMIYIGVAFVVLVAVIQFG